MRWACFALLVLALPGGFAYQYARHERSWDGAPDDEGERGLAEGAGDGLLDPWPWLWHSGTEEAAGLGFQRRQRRRQLRERRSGIVLEEGTHHDGPKPAAAAAVVVPPRASTKPWRGLQLLETGALRPFEQPTNFTTAGLRRAPPYAVLSNCFFVYVRGQARLGQGTESVNQIKAFTPLFRPRHTHNSPQCFNVTTMGYGTVQRCKFGRICEVCRGTPGRQNCRFVRVTGNPSGLGAQTSLSNVVIPGD